MHVSSGRWLYGLSLAMVTAVLWGILPIKLKVVLDVMDPVTVTWYRLITSGLVLLVWLSSRGALPAFRPLGRQGGALVLLAIAGLVSNYVLYLMGLNRLSPGTTQLVIQIAPFLLLISSLFVFREAFSVAQFLGLLVLLLGFGLFFNQRLGELLTSLTDYTLGVLTVVLAAVLWVAYGLAQKQLLNRWSSFQIMMVIYLGCALLLTPWVSPSQVLELDALQFWLLAACCLNTLVAYGAFAEALAHWEASRVSAALALTPLITFVGVALASSWWPAYVLPESLNLLAYGGALLVVLGSTVAALGHKRAKA